MSRDPFAAIVKLMQDPSDAAAKKLARRLADKRTRRDTLQAYLENCHKNTKTEAGWRIIAHALIDLLAKSNARDTLDSAADLVATLHPAMVVDRLPVLLRACSQKMKLPPENTDIFYHHVASLIADGLRMRGFGRIYLEALMCSKADMATYQMLAYRLSQKLRIADDLERKPRHRTLVAAIEKVAVFRAATRQATLAPAPLITGRRRAAL